MPSPHPTLRRWPVLGSTTWRGTVCLRSTSKLVSAAPPFTRHRSWGFRANGVSLTGQSLSSLESLTAQAQQDERRAVGGILGSLYGHAAESPICFGDHVVVVRPLTVDVFGQNFGDPRVIRAVHKL